MSDPERANRPDFAAGVDADAVPASGLLLGRVGDDDVVLARAGGDVFAVGAHCTHYHGPLAEGLIVDETLRCPWHHACFSLRTGEPRAPALDPIPCWQVERQGNRIFVREKLNAKPHGGRSGDRHPSSVVIVGGGAAGYACADMLRREGYDGPIAMISADESVPYDRPNLSKDYLAGTAQEDWIPLRGHDFYREQQIDLVLGTRVTDVRVGDRKVLLENGSERPFETLLIATGADPVRLPIPGADVSRVYYLRTFADSRALVERAGGAKRVVVIGASFIGLEVAASLRHRGIAVDVVAPESRPLERVMGPEMGNFIQSLHESQGVVFHLGQTVARMDGSTLTLSSGTRVDADFVAVGVGVRPALALAEKMGLTLDRGIAVNEYLETSVPGIFAGGDVARWPDSRSGEKIRVEHWVVAERQGQTVARNMLGRRQRFDAVPFFWSQHYDVAINYVGHAEQWDSVQIDGSFNDRDCAVSYSKSGRVLAVATVYRDRHSLEVEAWMERE